MTYLTKAEHDEGCLSHAVVYRYTALNLRGMTLSVSVHNEIYEVAYYGSYTANTS